MPPHTARTLLLLHLAQFGVNVMMGLLVQAVAVSLLSSDPFRWWHLPVLYWAMSVVAFSIHWLGHRNFWPRWFRAHTIEHHTKLYPSRRFLSDQPLSSADPNWKFYFPVFVGAFLLSWIGSGSLLGSLLAQIYMWACMWFIDYVHNALHIRGHGWERYNWFQILRLVHLQHHFGDMKRNYGIYDFALDWAVRCLVLVLN